MVVGLAASLEWLWLGDWQSYWGAELLAISAPIATLAVLLAIACRRRPSFLVNAAAHWVIFAWLSSYAFPWLGEVP